MAIASMVLGIISLVFVFSGFGSFIGFILGIIAVVLGAVAKSKKPPVNKGSATAGFIMGLISLIFGLIITISCVACIGVVSDLIDSTDFMDLQERIENFDWDSLEDVENWQQLGERFESF